MRAEIIAVGSELLLGQIVNTNAQFLSVELANHGIDVHYQVVVGDNTRRLSEVVTTAANRSDLVILTGGLGPTKDDLTKETIADFCNKKLVYDEDALTSIIAFFEKRKITMTDNNKKQALVIEGSRVLPNHYGMAPGMVVEAETCQFVLLPGPPREMEPMVVEQLRPLLQKSNVKNESITSRVLRFFGIGESKLEVMIDDLLRAQSNPTIAPLASEGEVTLRLTVKHHDSYVANQLLDETEAAIQARVGEFFYGYGESTLMNVLISELKEQKLTISSAESLTGGLFASELTSIAGVSDIFIGSIISYATKVKENSLDVSKELIDSHGVVSEPCADQMAKAIKQKLHSDIGISFTGVAGPSSQDNIAPGVVFIGICLPDNKCTVYQINVGGNREAVRHRAIKYGCFYLLNELKRWNLA
ncbi:competence/damage-inducible protein A [Alkalihalophilus sp. As8PL]|uniref:Putative competence-damage inducible protein n=1 Tax=Alkalihalophilus sp. As8PL TaxID=3237103 RepID=A0AB39BRZ1_9BACI